MKPHLRPEHIIFLILACFVFAYWLGLAVIDRSITKGHVIGGDGMFYYEYLPSVIIDGDLDFRNQREWLHSQGIPYDWGGITEKETSTGKVGTPFSVGWAVITAPFFLLAHAIVSFSSLPVEQPGYGFLYESVTNFGSVLGGLIGVVFAFRLLRLFFSSHIALISTVGFLLCSNLPYYIVVQASMAHSLGFFTITASSFYVVKANRSDLVFSKSVVLSGLFLGLAFLTRPQLLLAAICLYAYLVGSKNGALKCFASGLVAAAVASIQIGVWYILYGTLITIPQGDGFLRWADPHISSLLFSLRHGLFLWHPITLLAALGFGFMYERSEERTRFLWVCFVGFAFQCYINSIAADWWAGHSFGNRRFIDTYIFLIFPLATLLSKIKTTRVSWTLIMCFAIWNALFFIQYRFCYIPRGEAITWNQMLRDKFLIFTLDRPYCMKN